MLFWEDKGKANENFKHDEKKVEILPLSLVS
jgi:hypothetical protein